MQIICPHCTTTYALEIPEVPPSALFECSQCRRRFPAVAEPSGAGTVPLEALQTRLDAAPPVPLEALQTRLDVSPPVPLEALQTRLDVSPPVPLEALQTRWVNPGMPRGAHPGRRPMAGSLGARQVVILAGLLVGGLALGFLGLFLIS